ncbi:hypothetical protein [Streptomyces hainanensis]|uniref:PPE domain-containing protein n=1 Tax=Streptomyces hainanensis TaxID=402648 RepID=A0A4R4T7J3_9ACTN|nr:hypothetical protein [Streptomyces hainanensis]TDC72957.1 hypothetical protein E1283_20370 [Streptomyces hainanensis]
MATDEEFMAVIGRILSAQHVTIHAVAQAWTALATAGTAERDRLANAATNAEAERGAGLAELADRLGSTAAWADGASTVAQRVAGQLHAAGEASARATERALTLLVAYEAAQVDLPADAISPAMVSAAGRGEEEQERLLAEARSVLEQLGQDVRRVTGGDAPAAPERGGTVTADASRQSAPRDGDQRIPSDDRPGTRRPGPAADDGDNMIEGSPPAADARPGGGEYPSYLSVLGSEDGEFGGWVQSPNTGFLVDPATGREFDPGSGRWIDPVTGLPFGESTEYATRLSGLGGGPGATATGIGLAALGGGVGAVGGGGGLGGMYGGMVPPSVAHQGPARQQVLREAQRNLNQRAAVAQRFAMREAAQGGRPFAPPPASTGAGGRSNGDGSRESGRQGRPTDLTEDPDVWSAHRHAGRGVLGE